MTTQTPPTQSCHIQVFTASANGPYRWRLLSGNHRELGRGAASFTDAEEARVAIKQTQIVLTSLDQRIRRAPGNKWTWELQQHGVVVITSAHLFDRSIRCQQGLDQFIGDFPEAHIGADIMVSDTRRWRRAI